MMSLMFSRWRPLTSRMNFRFRFRFRCAHVLKTSGSLSVPNFVKVSQSTAELWLLPISENEWPPYWDSTSGFNFDLSVVMGISFCTGTPNFMWIGPLAAYLWRYVNFQDGGRQSCCTSCTAVMDHPRRAVDGMSFVVKFWTARMYGFGDIAIFRFWQFGLKMPIHAPFGWVSGTHSPK